MTQVLSIVSEGRGKHSGLRLLAGFTKRQGEFISIRQQSLEKAITEHARRRGVESFCRKLPKQRFLCIGKDDVK